MMQQILMVAAGGALGALLRFGGQALCNNAHFPYGTLAVNIIGCFLIGMFWAWTFQKDWHTNTRLFLMTGLCGGFTTFSAFTQESITMLLQGRMANFFLYILLSVAAGLLATFAGYKLFA